MNTVISSVQRQVAVSGRRSGRAISHALDVRFVTAEATPGTCLYYCLFAGLHPVSREAQRIDKTSDAPFRHFVRPARFFGTLEGI